MKHEYEIQCQRIKPVEGWQILHRWLERDGKQAEIENLPDMQFINHKSNPELSDSLIRSVHRVNEKWKWDLSTKPTNTFLIAFCKRRVQRKATFWERHPVAPSFYYNTPHVVS